MTLHPTAFLAVLCIPRSLSLAGCGFPTSWPEGLRCCAPFLSSAEHPARHPPLGVADRGIAPAAAPRLRLSPWEWRPRLGSCGCPCSARLVHVGRGLVPTILRPKRLGKLFISIVWGLGVHGTLCWLQFVRGTN